MPSTTTAADYFHALPDACLVLTRDLVMVDANPAYLDKAGHTLAELTGRHVAEVFPVNPEDPAAADRLTQAYERVVATGTVHHTGVIRYDFPRPDDPHRFDQRFWSVTAAPVLGEQGEVTHVLHRAREVTAVHSDLLRALTLYHRSSPDRHDPDDDGVEALADLTEAGMATGELTAALVAELGQLREAMRSRAAIEQAKGILMGARRCSADEAFSLLATLSQTTNTKLRDVAVALVSDATTPAAPGAAAEPDATQTVHQREIPRPPSAPCSSPPVGTTPASSSSRTSSSASAAESASPPAPAATATATGGPTAVGPRVICGSDST